MIRIMICIIIRHCSISILCLCSFRAPLTYAAHHLHALLVILLRSSADFPFLDGFFDAGMLRQALHANRQNQAAEPAVDRDVVRRNVGRRLRLSEY